MAARFGHADVVRALLDGGADLAAADAVRAAPEPATHCSVLTSGLHIPPLWKVATAEEDAPPVAPFQLESDGAQRPGVGEQGGGQAAAGVAEQATRPGEMMTRAS